MNISDLTNHWSEPLDALLSGSDCEKREFPMFTMLAPASSHSVPAPLDLMSPLLASSLDWIFRYLVLPFLLSAYTSVVVSRLYQFYDSKKDAWETIISMEDKLHLKSGTLTHPWANARLKRPTQRLSGILAIAPLFARWTQ